jgi:hypothetical protein
VDYRSLNIPLNSSANCQKLRPPAPSLAESTKSVAGGNRVLFCRKNSRIRRLRRFRTTADPTRFPTVIPNRQFGRPFGRRETQKCSVWDFFPSLRIFRKSARRRILSSLGKVFRPIIPVGAPDSFEGRESVFFRLND